MINSDPKLDLPLDAVFLDCDGTLSSIEGIDALANVKGVGQAVETMTADAMGKSGINPLLYWKRLDLVKPTREEMIAVGDEYFAHCTPDAYEVIQCFKRLGKAVYIISAGLYPSVARLGELLKVESDHVYAVQVFYTPEGQFKDFDRSSPLANRDGKRLIVEQLKALHPRVMHVGDGLNDYAVYDLVARFVGYGGAFYRENIADRCEFYIREPTLAPLLALGLTEAEVGKLTPDEKVLHQKGLNTL